MCAGLPIVAPIAPGNQDIVIHEKTGLLIDFEKGDHELAHGMKKLIQDESLRIKFANMARLESRKYTIEQTVDKTVALYERLLKSR